MSSNGTVREDYTGHDEPSTSKRRRIAFSCRDCRRRKLKCDRLFPSCSRCQKGGHSAACTYDSEAVESRLPNSAEDGTRGRHEVSLGPIDGLGTDPVPISVVRSFVADDREDMFQSKGTKEHAVSRLQAAEERIHQLENRIVSLEASSRQWSNSSGRSAHIIDSGPAPDQRQVAISQTMIFKGRHFKTQFFGASNHTSCLSHLPELRSFMKNMHLHHSNLACSRRGLKATQIRESSQEAIFPINGSTLRGHLPSREIVDRLVQVYIDTIESTHRILHLPSFSADYHAYWAAPHESSPAFAALVLLMIATTNCMVGEASSAFRGASSVKRESAMLWIKIVDIWLQNQSQKHVSTIIFQLHCLSFLAKKANSVKRKRTWTSAGNLLRLAMSAGLHRDAQLINTRYDSGQQSRVSVFDQEVRRRIWATISEMELQAALERGMAPAMTRDILEDCGTPLNLEDEDFDQSSDQLPTSRPFSQLTRSSFQSLARSSWSLRLEITALINGSNYRMAYEEVLFYDSQIMQHLSAIPRWESPQGLLSQALLQIQLEELLLFLHRPYAQSLDYRHEYSKYVHLKSAMTIVDIHDQLAKADNKYLLFFRNDILGAALSICYNESSFESQSVDCRLAIRNATVHLGDLTRYLETGLRLLDEKIMCLGVGLQEYYCVSAILGLLRQRLSPGSKSNEGETAAERIFHVIYKVLALQDRYSAAATLANLPNTQLVRTTSESNGQRNGHKDEPVAPTDTTVLLQDFGPDLEGLDLTNIAGWDLDAFWNFS